jgi:hypothetical protein
MPPHRKHSNPNVHSFSSTQRLIQTQHPPQQGKENTQIATKITNHNTHIILYNNEQLIFQLNLQDKKTETPKTTHIYQAEQVI